MLVFILLIFNWLWIKMETRITDTFKLCLTCLSSKPKVSSLPIRSVLLVTAMTTSQVNLEGKNGWWPRMAGIVTCLSVTGWPTYLSDALLMKICSNIPRCPLLHLESGIHRIYMTKTNWMTLTTMQDLVPKFLLPVIPDQTMYLIPYYNLYNTRPSVSPFQIMWPSPRVLPTMNYSSIYQNLTPTNLTIMMASLHLLYLALLAPTIYMLPHIT